MPEPTKPLLTPSHRLRRQFLKGTFGTIIAAIAAYFSWTKYLFAPQRTGSTLGSVSQFKENAAPVFITPSGADITYAVENDGGDYRVLNAKCTHQGCTVDWDKATGQFLCPCHSARFDRTGQVVNGPAKRPLDTVKTDVRGDELFILS